MTDVILIDNRPILLSALKMFLDAQEDIGVIGTASDAFSAADIIKTKMPQVVLLDVSMTEINGTDLVSKIKKVSPDSKILILNMNEDNRYMEHAISEGASGFLPEKAMDYDLIYAIRTVARGETYIHPLMLKNFMAKDEGAVMNNPSREELLWNTLSDREKEVMIGIAEGFKNKEIAAKHFLSEKTIATYRLRGMEKLGFSNRSELVDLIFFKLKNFKKI